MYLLYHKPPSLKVVTAAAYDISFIFVLHNNGRSVAHRHGKECDSLLFCTVETTAADKKYHTEKCNGNSFYNRFVFLYPSSKTTFCKNNKPRRY